MDDWCLARDAGEHTCIVVRPLASAEVQGTDWLDPFVADFRVRLMTLLPSAFRCGAARPGPSDKLPGAQPQWF